VSSCPRPKIDPLTKTGAWQFNADVIETIDSKRLITGKAKLPHPELPFIFVTGRGMVILLL
jgi:hypothetical protein